MAISFTTQARSDRATALIATIGTSATVRIYDGTPPASANAALASNNLLGNLPASAAFGTVSNGVLTAGAISTTPAAATGIASFGRVVKSDGSTVVLQFSVGTSGTDMILNSTSITAAGPISVSSFAITEA